MENLLINYFLTNCKALTKGFFSQEKAPTQEGGGALDFLSILNGKMGSEVVSMGSTVESGIIPVTDNVVESDVIAAIISSMGSSVTTAKGSIDETAPMDKKGEVPQESEKEEQKTLSLPTQNIIALLQTYFHMKAPQETNLQDNIEKFLNGVFTFLQEGESVEFVNAKGSPALFALMRGDGKETGEISEGVSDGSQKKPENMPLIGCLAAMLHRMGNIEKTDGKNTNPKTEDSNENGVNNPIGKIVNNENSNTDKNEIDSGVYNPVNNIVNSAVNNENGNPDKQGVANIVNNLGYSAGLHAENISGEDKGRNRVNTEEKPIVVIDRETISAFKKPEIVSGIDPEGKRNDDVVKSVQKIEIKKIDGRENLFQITTHESKAMESDELNKNISVVSIKADKTISASDDDSPKVLFKVSEKEIDNDVGKDQRQLLGQNDYTKMSAHTDKETGKAVEKTAFASVMADRIEKIAEQYANRGVSTDMVIRLKIDDNETILVGLKDLGQRISVEVKTADENMGNFLMSQKEEIAKQLEGKFVYANIYVDVQNDGSQQKEQKEQQQKKHAQEENKKDFGVFLEALA